MVRTAPYLTLHFLCLTNSANPSFHTIPYSLFMLHDMICCTYLPQRGNDDILCYLNNKIKETLCKV